MKNILKKIFKHKIILVIAILIIAFGVRFGWQKLQSNKDGEPQYILSAVEKGTITISVSGTGQVSVSNQVDIKPEASGRVTYVNIENGQEVKTGGLIAQLDAADAFKSVRDAQANLESAKLSLEKLQQPIDDLDILKAENTLAKAQEALPNAEADLDKAYEDGFNDISDAFLDLPSVMSGLEGVLLGHDITNNQSNIDYYTDRARTYNDQIDIYGNKAQSSYQKARSSYDQTIQDYKEASRYSDNETIEELIDNTYAAVKDMSEAIKDAKNLVDFFEDTFTVRGMSVPAVTSTHKKNLESYTGTANGHLTNLLSAKNAIDSSKEDIVNAERDLKEKEGSLAELLAGPDSLDVRSQELSIKQKENALWDAQQKLADYYVRAPFDGVIAELNIRKGESISSGTAVATLITTQKIAEITLNEIDVAQVKVGQKATLEFDAVAGLSITGEVVEIDALGAVSQGVVSYGVKIAFDIQDERIKPGMSLSVNIIIDSKRDVLTVPVSAVKAIGGSSYVEVLVNGRPQQKTVNTGLSNDLSIEITDGLQEGDQIITQTISTASNSGTSGASSQNQNFRGGQNDAGRSIMMMTR